MKTLEEYIRENWARAVSGEQVNSIDHTFRINVDEEGVVSLYIHPANMSGDTLDFVVEGNALRPDPRITRSVEIENAL